MPKSVSQWYLEMRKSESDLVMAVVDGAFVGLALGIVAVPPRRRRNVRRRRVAPMPSPFAAFEQDRKNLCRDKSRPCSF